MSRIDTRPQPFLNHSPGTGIANTGSPTQSGAAASSQRLQQVRKKTARDMDVRPKTAKRLSSAKQIAEADLHPLRGRKRDHLIADITRILASIREIDDLEGEDETSKLCKMMLEEHVRRLMLVQNTQIESDGLKGTA